MDKSNNELYKLGGVYKFQFATGSVVSGVLIGRSENLVKDKIEVYYRLALNESKYIEFCENEVVVLYSDDLEEKVKYFYELEQKCNVKCFSEEGQILDSSKILREVLSDNKWNDLSDEEKKELIEYTVPNVEDIVDLINAYMFLKKDNQTLYDDKIRVLDATKEIVDRYTKFENRVLTYPHVYDLFFKELGMGEFIKKVC